MLSDFPELMDLLACEASTSLSGKHIYYLERRGLFPKRVKLGRRSAWVRAEIRAWIAERISARGVIFSDRDAAPQPRDGGGRFTPVECPKAEASTTYAIRKQSSQSGGRLTKVATTGAQA